MEEGKCGGDTEAKDLRSFLAASKANAAGENGLGLLDAVVATHSAAPVIATDDGVFVDGVAGVEIGKVAAASTGCKSFTAWDLLSEPARPA